MKKILSSLPIIDIGAYMKNEGSRHKIAKDIRQISKQIGFFYIKNHGVPLALQQSIIKNMKAFFQLSLEEKNEINMNKGVIGWKGYAPIGTQYRIKQVDFKEGLFFAPQFDANHPKVIHKNLFFKPNLFPRQIPQLKQDILEWFKHMSIVGDALMQAISESLNLDRYFLRNSICKQHTGLLRALHYPTVQGQDQEVYGAGQHTDYGLLTILLMSDKGLQAQDRQLNWINVDPIPDTFAINIGDVLQKITNGLYKSTPHRAKNINKRSRYSLPYFYDPGWDAEMKVLDIKITQRERQLQRQCYQYKRWDNLHMKQLEGVYSDYLIKKLSISFPELKNIL